MPTMRKVCASMPKQLYILILLGLGISLLLGQVNVQNTSELWFNNDSSSPELQIHDRLNASLTTSSGLRIGVSNDFFKRDFKLNDATQKRYNSLHAFASYGFANTALQAGIRNTLYGDATNMALFPIIQPDMAYDKQMQNSVYFSVSQELAAANLQLEGMARTLDVKPWEYILDPETFELTQIERADDRLFDLEAKLSFGLELRPDLVLYTSYLHHESDLDNSARSTLAQSQLGLQYQTRLLDLTDLSASFDWQNRQGDFSFGERSNLYNSQLRLNYNVNPQISLSLAYTNHLCSDPTLSEILLISNNLRSTVKYSYDYDESGASYSVIAAKYSPEHNASAILLDTDLKTLNRLWFGAELLYNPDAFALYKLKTSYSLGSYNSVRLIYEYRTKKADSSHYQQLGIGLSYYY